nr:MAG TPA: hypothetical protein [Caudoviricetes sp.]
MFNLVSNQIPPTRLFNMKFSMCLFLCYINYIIV